MYIIITQERMTHMKKIIAWLLVLTLTAAISIGATLAYLTDTDEDVNVMTLGEIKIDQLEYERVDDETANEDADVQEFHDNKPIYPAITGKDFDYTPGDTNVDWTQIGKDGYTSDIWDPTKINNELDKMVFVKNKGDYDAYVRSVFAFEANGYTLDQFKDLFHLNLNDTDWTWEWVEEPVAIPNEDGTVTTNYIIAVATYNKALEPGKLTEISLSQIALDSSAGNADIEGFGDTYQILVKTQAIQAQGFENPITALNDGFGAITAQSVPFETDNPIRGTDLRTALHNLNGDTTNVITAKVTNVTFGKTADYADIADTYDGTLVDIEQDIPVHAYYVPNGSNYDIYFLSNDKVFLPGDCNGLFRNMTALKSINSGNMDTSRVTTMRNMIRECQNLTTLDVSTWDTSSVNDMAFLFYNCYRLTEIIGLKNFDTSNVTTLRQTFALCKALKALDLAGWDTSNVTDMNGLFGQCFVLETLDTTGWDTSKNTSTRNMFYNDYKLQEIVGSGDWYMPANTDMYCMFQNCDSLKSIDATSWDLSSVENMYSAFWSCGTLESIIGAENWDTGNVTTMKAMFEDTHKLKYIDVSTWDTSSVEDMSHMFRAHGIEELDVSKWDVSNVKYFNSMFSATKSNTGDMSIKKLDLTNWNLASAVAMQNMFQGCSKLTELDLSGWNMPNNSSVSHMFADCFGLLSINLSGWNTPALTSMDGMFNDCRSLKVVDVSDIDTANVVEFSQIFEACYALETIIGLDQWDTSKGIAFDEMFNLASKIKELDLSSFDTGSAKSYGVMQNGGIYYGFSSMFNGTTGLQKLVLGEKFVFSGDGSISQNGYPRFPNPAPIDGQATKWYNAENDTYYAPSEIPEKTAATYVAAIPPQG